MNLPSKNWKDLNNVEKLALTMKSREKWEYPSQGSVPDLGQVAPFINLLTVSSLVTT